MPDQIIVPNNTNSHNRFRSYFINDKKKVVVLFFIIFSIAVAIQTVYMELKSDKPTSQTPSITVIPTATPTESLSGNSKTVTLTKNTSRYENNLIGFYFDYPSEVGIIREDGVGNPSANTVIVKIEELNSPYNTKASALRNDRSQLETGSFGLEIDPGSYLLKGVVSSGATKVKIYTNLESTDCRGIAMEKVAQFYKFDRRITLTLRGPKARMVKDSPAYFTKGVGECSNALTWTSIGKESFLAAISSKTAPDYVLKWNSDFSNIVSSIRLVPPTDPELFQGSVKGRWQGENMVVSLVANNKLGKVTEMKLWYSDHEEGNWEAFQVFKMVPSKEKVNVRYKDQYGNESKVFSTKVEFK